MGEESPTMIALDYDRPTDEEMRARADAFATSIRKRRTVREFSAEAVPEGVIERCIEAAAQAPSGANKQPWTYVLVRDPSLKKKIREAAEKEERAFYGGRAPPRWLADLEAFGTNANKPFLETAPALIVVFAQRYGESQAERHYYVNESVGISVGFLIAALHHAGLATLTHTPSPMKFLAEILGRPESERAFLLLPVGYPAADCQVPAIERKPLDTVMIVK